MQTSSSGSSPGRRSPQRRNTELSLLSTKSYYATYHPKGPHHSISILMLENYLSDICKAISEHKSITHHTYTQIPPIKKVLSDCMNLSNITLEFYTQVDSALNLIRKIFEFECGTLIKDLVRLLAKICDMIAKGEHFSCGVSVPVRQNFGKSLEECSEQLNVRINRVTPRVVNIWRNIVTGVKEIELVSYGFLRFYSEVDPLVPKPGFADPVVAMIRYARNPGHLVQVVRKTQLYLEGEMISLRTVREVSCLMQKTPPEVLTCVDKTLTGYILWDLIRFALEYYRAYGLFHYKIDIFDKNLVDGKSAGWNLMNSVKVLPGCLKGELGSVSKENEKLGRNRTEMGLKKKLSFESPFKVSQFLESCKDYEDFVNEKFQEFLQIKLKQFPNMALSKTEIMNDFNKYIKTIDQATISRLWEPKNLTKTAFQLSF